MKIDWGELARAVQGHPVLSVVVQEMKAHSDALAEQKARLDALEAAAIEAEAEAEGDDPPPPAKGKAK